MDPLGPDQIREAVRFARRFGCLLTAIILAVWLFPELWAPVAISAILIGLAAPVALVLFLEHQRREQARRPGPPWTGEEKGGDSPHYLS